jgi:hypothetical protein
MLNSCAYKVYSQNGEDGIIDISQCFTNDKVKFKMEHRWPRTKNMEWISV